MTEDGDIAIDDPMYRFCVSWYIIRVANLGIGLLVSSWNEHRIPRKYLFYLYHLVPFFIIPLLNFKLAEEDPEWCEEFQIALRLRVSVVPTHLIAVRLLLDIGKKIPTSSFELE